MKSLYSLAFLGACILGANRAQAQSTSSFGVKAGLSNAVLDGTINEGGEYKMGLHAGIFIRWRPSAHFALQPEFVYAQQGSNNKVPIGNNDIEYKNKLTYLNMPILAKIYLGKVVNLQVGPQFGLLLSARRVGQTGYTSSGSGTSYQTADVETTDDYKNDLAVCGGLGADLPNGLTVAARLNYGFTDIDNNSQSQAARKYYGIGGLHNRTIEFSLGYVFQH